MRRRSLAVSLSLAWAGPAWAQQVPATDNTSMTALWIITLTVIGLVIVFGGIASMVSRKRKQPRTAHGEPKTPAEVAGAVASLETAGAIAEKAHESSEQPSRAETTLGDKG